MKNWFVESVKYLTLLDADWGEERSHNVLSAISTLIELYELIGDKGYTAMPGFSPAGEMTLTWGCGLNWLTLRCGQDYGVRGISVLQQEGTQIVKHAGDEALGSVVSFFKYMDEEGNLDLAAEATCA